MNDKSIPSFRTIGTPLEVNDRELDELNDRLGVPTLRRGGQAPGRSPSAAPTEPGRAPLEKLTLEVPNYLSVALRCASAEKRMSVRHLVMLALRDAGYAVEDVDMIPDGRRARGKQR